MNYKHKALAAGRWDRFPFIQQMANIGSEVERALNWQDKGNRIYCQKAFERALELLNLTIENQTIPSHLKELTRLREAIIDYFFGTNQFMSTNESWKKYFLPFAFFARKNY
jgi:hypothetical protein